MLKASRRKSAALMPQALAMCLIRRLLMIDRRISSNALRCGFAAAGRLRAGNVGQRTPTTTHRAVPADRRLGGNCGSTSFVAQSGATTSESLGDWGLHGAGCGRQRQWRNDPAQRLHRGRTCTSGQRAGYRMPVRRQLITLPDRAGRSRPTTARAVWDRSHLALASRRCSEMRSTPQAERHALG